MDKGILNKAILTPLENEDINKISENGRGLALIKEFMDKLNYSTTDGKNCFTIPRYP